MDVHPDSANHAITGARTTVESFIKGMGLPLPDSHFKVSGLSVAVIDRSQVHPLGNLEGALGWPVPMSADDQQQLRNLALNYAGVPAQPTVNQPRGLLEALREQTTLSPEVLADPVKTLNALVSSAQAQALGKHLQERMEHVATQSSAMDHLLAAITLQLDPESITETNRNLLAGFDLADKNNWGKTADTVVDALAKHLIAKGKTSPDLAAAAAYLLLSSRAPVFLIKDIPKTVTYGSPAWVNLAVAAATIEAQTPGRVANMSFVQVMLEAENASLADLAVTHDAQREALIDWGVVHGVLEKKADHLYSAEELTALLNEFNARKALMASATEVYDKDLPSRALKADTVLKEHFSDLEAIWDERLIHVSIQGRRPWGDIFYEPGPVGPHSLRDIVMMDLKGPLRYSSKDARVPLDKLNATPSFGVRESFNQEFKEAIKEKKVAVHTGIRHMISQLPMEQRLDFELGKISFFQTQTTTLGTGFTDKTLHPKEEALLVRIERDGKTTAYEVSFNEGSIRSLHPSSVGPRKTRNRNEESETKAFKPSKGADQLGKQHERTDKTIPDSFSSTRTQLFADAFVEHINLDDNAIREQALGLTYDDKNRKRAEAFEGFVLNLVPFYSAINNFREGNIGSGLLDLGLDLFGFLTAGVATAGKVLKIASTTASALNKGARVIRAIGLATMSAVNPLGGLGDAAVGTVRLAGKGLGYISRKGIKGVNTLRGATGSYDLLKLASKDSGTVATGMLKMGGQSVESAAVLKHGKWYAFDPDQMRPFGKPLDNFTPSTVAVNGQLNQSYSDRLYRWLNGDAVPTQGPPSVLGQFVPTELVDALQKAKAPKNLDSFNMGFEHGDPLKILGYSADMNLMELQALASQRWLSPEQVGTLAKQIVRKKVGLIQEGFTLFQRDVKAAGGTVLPMPQEFYLSQVNLTSPGECAGIANTTALAILSGDEAVYLGNMFKAAATPTAADSSRFIKDLNAFHNAVSGSQSFHMGKTVTQMPYHKIGSELEKAAPPKILRIASQDHALLAGVVMRDNKPVWFYLDPNFGLAKFDSAEALKDGLERTLNRGTSPFQHRAHGDTPGMPEYSVSTFDASDMGTYVDANAVKRMATAPL
ncbi:hypothetical protein DK871_11175 [Pseudomonas sp. L13]|nr:hypothetical protein [Pseudomonas sp. L13]